MAASTTMQIPEAKAGVVIGRGGRVLGVVLNGVRVTTGGYLRKNYDTFYEYQEQGQFECGNRCVR